MALKLYKPTTPTRRHSSVVDYRAVAKQPLAPRRLLRRMSRSGGRNQSGKITVRHIGGGARKKLRVVDRLRDKLDIPARVVSLEYDPNRSAFLALLSYQDGEKRYIIAPAGLPVGARVMSSSGKVEVAPGNRTALRHIPAGTLVHDIELQPGRGGVVASGAGAAATVMAAEGEFAILKMPSGELRKFFAVCRATIGAASNPDHMNVRLGRAGRVRRTGVRPTVRGKAMNPVDHPHGGGEGRNPIGLKYPKTPWGKHALGVKTRPRHKDSDKFILQRRRK